MKEHKFAVGTRVLFNPPPRHHAAASGDYIVAGLMPADGEGNQYRIENRADRHQRVVHEAELSKATFAPAVIPRNFSRY